MNAAFAYSIARRFRDIPVGKWAFVGRKRAGEMTWHYTMPSVERDFGLLARRIWR